MEERRRQEERGAKTVAPLLLCRPLGRWLRPRQSLLPKIARENPRSFRSFALSLFREMPLLFVRLPATHATHTTRNIMSMIEIVVNDRLGKKVRVKCSPNDTIGDLKKVIAAQTGTRPEKIRIQKYYTIYKDHITLADYEIHDGMGLELYVRSPTHHHAPCS